MKVLILGMDALDRILLDELAGSLPHFSAFRRRAQTLRVQSTFPPDSDTAWATIATGLNPAQHGVVRFVDPLEKSYQILHQSVDNQVLRGKTFWEIAAQNGYKACAVFPHLCYPLWETPAAMVARGSSAADVQSNPAELLDEYPDPRIILGVRGFPERTQAGMLDYYRRLSDLARADAEFALRLLKKADWDLFFAYWSTIDAIGHFFWNTFDPQDPNFVDGNPCQEVIPETYRLYDEILGRFLAAVGEEVTVIVMSDHGHGARPFKLVNVNEALRQGGFLAAYDRKAKPHIDFLESGKRLIVRTISRYRLGKLAARVLRRFPGIVQGFTRPAAVDWERTIAYATDMSGIKAYAYGGIRINRPALNGLDYETTRGRIIERVQQACVLPDGTPLIDFIAPREELYSGPFIDRYPDILLEMKYGYGVGWALNVPMMTQSASYNLVPGSHRGDTGVFIYRGNPPIHSEVIDLIDITPTVLGLFSICPEYPYQGKNLLTGGSLI